MKNKIYLNEFEMNGEWYSLTCYDDMTEKEAIKKFDSDCKETSFNDKHRLKEVITITEERIIKGN